MQFEKFFSLGCGPSDCGASISVNRFREEEQVRKELLGRRTAIKDMFHILKEIIWLDLCPVPGFNFRSELCS